MCERTRGYFLVACLLALPACGGGGSDPNDFPPPDPNPQPMPPGGQIPGQPQLPGPGQPGQPRAFVCHPALQQGCAVNEKCAALIDPNGALATQCVPQGNALPGAACTVSTTGADNCVSGYHCSGGTCQLLCGSTSTPFRCSVGGGVCAPIGAAFDEINGDRIGVCAESCDPVAQGCDGGQGCFLDLVAGVASCSDVPAAAAALGQDDFCLDKGDGSCLTNGCGVGFGPVVPVSFASPTPALCSQFCDPVATHTLAPGNPEGAPGGVTCPAGYQCRFVQSFYAQGSQIPASVGMCVSEVAWGDCRLCDISSRQARMQTCASQQAFGCADLATLNAAPF